MTLTMNSANCSSWGSEALLKSTQLKYVFPWGQTHWLQPLTIRGQGSIFYPHTRSMCACFADWFLLCFYLKLHMVAGKLWPGGPETFPALGAIIMMNLGSGKQQTSGFYWLSCPNFLALNQLMPHLIIYVAHPFPPPHCCFIYTTVQQAVKS